jgi:hypothetical protein
MKAFCGGPLRAPAHLHMAARPMPLDQRFVTGFRMKIQRPLINAQIHGDRNIRADVNGFAGILDLNILGLEGHTIFLRFLQNSLTNLLNALSIHAGLARDILDAILELIFIYQCGQHLERDINNRNQDHGKDDRFEISRSLFFFSSRVSLSGCVEVERGATFCRVCRGRIYGAIHSQKASTRGTRCRE